MDNFNEISKELLTLIQDAEPVLLAIPRNIRTERHNSQYRTIKQLVGHMVDSASNNTHRVIHLQYQNSPAVFPDYANLGNNDKWLAIQNYQDEDWETLVQLWKYTNIHFAHVILNVNPDKLENVWISALNQEITLKEMILDFPRHFRLHLSEISDLMTPK